MMKRSSNTRSSFRLWWRRQSFYFRRLPCKWVVFLCICVLYSLTIIPNPFSSEYTRISINQDVEWNSISEILQAKETVGLLFSFKNYDSEFRSENNAKYMI
jgi:hypothetical protein